MTNELLAALILGALLIASALGNIAQALTLGRIRANIAKFDHDGDGKPGGSRKARA